MAIEKKKTKKRKKIVKKVDNKKVISKKKHKKMSKEQFYSAIVITFVLGILLIFSSYAWFSTSLNVKIKNFNMIVSRNSGLSISFDGITFGSFIEISEETLIKNLKKTYPNNTSQWSSNGLTPVSSNGIIDSNSSRFEIYASGGVRYRNKKQENGFITTFLTSENSINSFNYYIAFDLFLKNVTGSPISDNLYLDYGTAVTMDSDSSEEMLGLVNSVRIGFVKIGSVPLNTDVYTIQNIACNNNCSDLIYEPNSLNHTDLSIERAFKYGINLVKNELFPTFGCIKGGGPIYVKDTVSGSPNIDTNYFALQQTINEDDFDSPIFEVPDGITKMRVYVWIEGQDIDSLETASEGADISISINLIKDTKGYNSFN